MPISSASAATFRYSVIPPTLVTEAARRSRHRVHHPAELVYGQAFSPAAMARPPLGSHLRRVEIRGRDRPRGTGVRPRSSKAKAVASASSIGEFRSTISGMPGLIATGREHGRHRRLVQLDGRIARCRAACTPPPPAQDRRSGAGWRRRERAPSGGLRAAGAAARPAPVPRNTSRRCRARDGEHRDAVTAEQMQVALDALHQAGMPKDRGPRGLGPAVRSFLDRGSRGPRAHIGKGVAQPGCPASVETSTRTIPPPRLSRRLA